ncbi:hypothetical protein FQA39_LY14361 [Lamprigera yunnana]|nr:hypothetical protein FQA39_LY14361 [Lamprigera yunnana]
MFFFNKNDKYSAKTLFILKNPQWRLTRNKVTSIFSSRKFKNMIPLIVNASDQLINKIKTISLCNDSIDVRDLCLKYGIDVISLCGFRFEAKAQENSQFQSAARNLLGETLLRNIATSSYFYSPFLVKLFGFNFFDRKSAEFLEKVLLNIIQNRKVSKQLHGDMTDMLIQMIENPHFDLNGGISLALNLIIAGFETTGNVLSYILYELCLNQSIQDRLGEEIFHTTTQKHESISLHAILEMKYLEMVVKEGLRKYPPLPFLDRVCTNNYTIPGTDVVIEKGTPVFISIWALHHDQNNFKNPEIFDPDRFSSANKSNIISCTYMPFGEGHRNCIGTNLGILAISIALIQILKHFKLELRDTSLKLNTKSTSFLLVPSDNVLYLKFKPIA